ncbi:HesA/MoeB/ThiF family protein [Sphingomonas sp. Leaf343]|uniref:HesA/MoeB/ThiF family protein n=1 Tax=Sphingomonas sp. Leaf343 TaxID=1736345 RepID=UPI0006F25DDD|nr:molybdopterin-synthase adenylyltransferase MoeB [Sphingomonas sp. Leaf343]KQR86215.1 molybdopterin biosynthesis protein MoeB [Sphingomonas sp. Leaf343]
MTPLSDEELARYARHIVLREVGGSGQMRIRGASVAIVGCGGIGSPAIQYLAAAGVGRLVLIDGDRVDLSNLQRQTIFSAADVGESKAAAAARSVAAINPNVAVDIHDARIDADNAAALLAGTDTILDGCDNFATRLLVADTALTLRTPLVSAAVGQFDGQLAVFRGWEAGAPCYRCFVGDAPGRDEASCAEQGVLGPVTGILGSLAALEVLRVIAPFGDDPAGSVMLIDLLSSRFRSIRLPKDPGCSACAG